MLTQRARLGFESENAHHDEWRLINWLGMTRATPTIARARNQRTSDSSSPPSSSSGSSPAYACVAEMGGGAKVRKVGVGVEATTINWRVGGIVGVLPEGSASTHIVIRHHRIVVLGISLSSSGFGHLDGG